jgi:Glycosyltransferase family 87
MSGAVSASGLRTAVNRLAWPATIVFFAALPALVVALLFYDAVADDAVAFDFRPFYGAAEAVLRGDDPYPAAGDPLHAAAAPYVYPPLPALVTTPLTVLPFDAAGLFVMAALVLAALATLHVLGVRDWRCYGLVLLWPPVISAIQTGNVTLWFALASAIAWRYRERVVPASAAIGITLATKFFLWPLVVWIAATRRLASAVAATAIGAGFLLLSWATIGFDGLLDYPDLLRRLEDTVGADSYTAYIVGLDIGLPSAVARGVWLALGLALLAAVVALGRRGEERAAFILAIVSALALTPIVWLHYFALLVVVVAVAQPRLGPVWFVPLAMVVTPGSGQPTPFETAATLTIALVTVVLALRATRENARPAREGLEASGRPRAQAA